MRIALFSDVHGNAVALDAVLADVREVGGVDEYWVVGDLAALGPQPVDVMERLDDVGVHMTRGNTDRFVVTGTLPSPTADAVRADPKLITQMTDTAAGFGWTKGFLYAAGMLGRLDELPLERRLTLPDGTRLLAVHASPGKDSGSGIHEGLSDEEVSAMGAESEADLIVAGHTHRHLDRTADGCRVVNLGSVSLPQPSDRRASWSILEARTDGYTIEHRRVEYDLTAVLGAIESSRYPGAAWLSGFFQSS